MAIEERIERLEQRINQIEGQNSQPTTTRRGALVLTGAAAMTVLSGTAGIAAAAHNGGDRPHGTAMLIGTESQKPSPGDQFFANKSKYHYFYVATDSGARYTISTEDTDWTKLDVNTPSITTDNINNVEYIDETADLPPVSNGRHQLEDSTAYRFNGFITSTSGLELANSSPLLGSHGGIDGFIHTGGATAIRGRDANYLSRDMYLHAPAGTIYDLQATQSEEMLVESISISDAAGLGNISDLGTIDGFRVPTWKGCNFEDFNAGLTFTGTPDKVFVSNSPLRGVTASGVTILEFDSNFTTDIVDLPNNYVKSVQSDTVVIDVDGSATINEIFQYVGNTHDSTVTQSNILTGAAGADEVGYRVKNSFPIVDSRAIANYTLDSDSTVTISTAANSKTDGADYVKVPGSTTSTTAIRFSHANNEATYDGKKDTDVRLQAVLSLGTSSGDTVAAAWFKDGSIVNGTPTRVQTQGTGNAVGQPVSSIGIATDVTTNASFDIRVANLDSTTDIEVGEMNGALDADV